MVGGERGVPGGGVVFRGVFPKFGFWGFLLAWVEKRPQTRGFAFPLFLSPAPRPPGRGSWGGCACARVGEGPPGGAG